MSEFLCESLIFSPAALEPPTCISQALQLPTHTHVYIRLAANNYNRFISIFDCQGGKNAKRKVIYLPTLQDTLGVESHDMCI